MTLANHLPPVRPLSGELFSFAGAAVKYPSRTEKYARFIGVMDSPADELVMAFSQLPSGRGRKMLDTALNHGIEAVPDAPPALRRFFEPLDDVPMWVDWDQLALGGRAVLRSGLTGAIALGLYALPMDYSSPAGAKPLVFSGVLVKRASRRLAETGRFALSCCEPGGLQRFSDGFKTTVRVRLMHAQVRRLILHSGRWNDAWGAPINQAFMAGTIISLSFVLLDGLRQLGWALSPAERDGIMQIWRYAAYLSGVDPELTAATEAEGRRLFNLMVETKGAPDADSRALVDALMNIRLFPGTERFTWMADLYSGLARGLIGSPIADELELPKTAWVLALPAVRTLVWGHEVARRVIPGGDQLALRAGTRLWNLALNSALGGKPAEYHLPERLDPLMKERPGEKRYA